MNIPGDILPIVYVDGAFVPAGEARVSAFDRGLLLADGLFETLHVVEGVPLELQPHLERLEGSARFMRLRVPFDRAGFRVLAAELLRRNGVGPDPDDPGLRELALRVTLTRGTTPTGPPTLTMFLRRLTEGHRRKRSEGVLAQRLPFVRHATDALAQHKTLAYLASALGQIVLRERTDDPRVEGLFVTDRGEVLEGAGSNVFAVEGRRLVTPPVDLGLLPGTSRRAVLALAATLDLTAHEEPLPLARVRAADEVFITSSTLPVAPVVALDDAPVGGGRPGPVTRALQAAFAARVQAEIAAWRAEPSEASAGG